MAAANPIARFESKLDALSVKIDSLHSELRKTRWVMVAGFAALAIAAIAQLLRG